MRKIWQWLVVAAIVPALLVGCGEDTKKKVDKGNAHVRRLNEISATLSAKGIVVQSYLSPLSLPSSLTAADIPVVEALLKEYISRGNSVLNITKDGDVRFADKALLRTSIANANSYLVMLERFKVTSRATTGSGQPAAQELTATLQRKALEAVALNRQIQQQTGVSAIQSPTTDVQSGFANRMVIDTLDRDKLMTLDSQLAALIAKLDEVAADANALATRVTSIQAQSEAREVARIAREQRENASANKRLVTERLRRLGLQRTSTELEEMAEVDIAI